MPTPFCWSRTVKRCPGSDDGRCAHRHSTQLARRFNGGRTSCGGRRRRSPSSDELSDMSPSDAGLMAFDPRRSRHSQLQAFAALPQGETECLANDSTVSIKVRSRNWSRPTPRMPAFWPSSENRTSGNRPLRTSRNSILGLTAIRIALLQIDGRKVRHLVGVKPDTVHPCRIDRCDIPRMQAAQVPLRKASYRNAGLRGSRRTNVRETCWPDVGCSWANLEPFEAVMSSLDEGRVPKTKRPLPTYRRMPVADAR